jgi:hypothetical protein
MNLELVLALLLSAFVLCCEPFLLSRSWNVRRDSSVVAYAAKKKPKAKGAATSDAPRVTSDSNVSVK